MARIVATDSRIDVVFSWWETPFVLRRRLELDPAEITKIELVERPLRAHLGPRAGFWITGLIKVGYFGSMRRCLSSVRRGVPAVRLRLDGARTFHEVLVSDPRARELATLAAAP